MLRKGGGRGRGRRRDREREEHGNKARGREREERATATARESKPAEGIIEQDNHALRRPRAMIHTICRIRVRALKSCIHTMYGD